MTNFFSPASRHWDNSRFLANHDRYQEAAYLAGYAAECAPSALVEQGGLHGRPFGHSLVNLSGDGLELALLLSPLLRRYQVEPVIQDMPGLGQWRETHRYGLFRNSRGAQTCGVQSKSIEILTTLGMNK